MKKVVILTLLLASLLGTVAARHNQSQIDNPLPVKLTLVAEGLTAPLVLVQPPDGSGRLFVADQIGLIRIIASDGTLQEEPFLDLRSRVLPLNASYDERGLLGLAFHPNYVENGRFFVYYSAPLRAQAPAGYDHTNRIAEFHVTATDPDQADASSERIILQVDQPQNTHNAGELLFGPDGYLYIALGDGGGARDVGLGHVDDWFVENGGGNGQDIEQNLLGSILRIDVDNDLSSGVPYAIPTDNPFVGGPGLDEIYAYGFRNPYRASFDKGGNHDLLVSDAGQALWEEVSLVNKGGNYGWNVKEGTHCFDAENPNVVPAACPSVVGLGHPRAGDPLIDPVIEYANNRQAGGLGEVVVGGYVYRGGLLPELSGRYIFGDWSKGFAVPDGSLFAAEPRAQGLWPIRELAFLDRPAGRLGHYLLAFGQDTGGEVYVLTSDLTGPTGATGKVYKLAPTSEVVNVTPLLRLDRVKVSYLFRLSETAPAGILKINATITNVSSSTMRGLFFTVTRLTGRNVVLNATGGPGGVGAMVPVPPEAFGADAMLQPGESFFISFRIGLAQLRAFSFDVDAFGRLDEEIAGASEQAGGSIRFELSEEELHSLSQIRSLYLPSVVR
jgi:glucose/arabinose dehydrogenase